MCQQFRQYLQLEENKIFPIKIILKIIKYLKIYFKVFSLSILFINFSAFASQENYFYEVQFGNLIVGQAEISINSSNKKIELNSKSKTAGFLNVFYEYVGELNSSSIKKANTWIPNKFLANGIFNNKARSSDLEWGVNNSVNYKNIPIINLKKFHPIDKESLINVIDPVTAFLNVIERIRFENKCDTSFKIFDGRRRYDLKTKTLGNSFIENDRPKSYRGDVLICGLKITPLGGHRLKTKWKPIDDKFTDFKLFFGRTVSGRILPVRMNLERWFGTITVRLLEKRS